MAAAVRRLDLRTVPAGKFARLRAEATDAAAGYSLVRWTGPTPPEYRGPLARVLNAYADAPHDEGFEVEAWDADQVRERPTLRSWPWGYAGTRSRRPTTQAESWPG